MVWSRERQWPAEPAKATLNTRNRFSSVVTRITGGGGLSIIAKIQGIREQKLYSKLPEIIVQREEKLLTRKVQATETIQHSKMTPVFNETRRRGTISTYKGLEDFIAHR